LFFLLLLLFLFLLISLLVVNVVDALTRLRLRL